MDDSKYNQPSLKTFMIWGIDSDVKRRYKMACLQNGVSMRADIIAHMKATAKNAGL